jgi:hypothetical protein
MMSKKIGTCVAAAALFSCFLFHPESVARKLLSRSLRQSFTRFFSRNREEFSHTEKARQECGKIRIFEYFALKQDEPLRSFSQS